jgi:transcriptional regulator with XRE-family HTH domain
MTTVPISPLRRLRLERGLSIHDVASAVSTHPANLSKIERQIRGASPALAERLATFFQPDLTELEILYPDRFEVES